MQTWGLHKVLALKESLVPLLCKLLKFVGRSEVNDVAVYLGLLEEAELEAWLVKAEGDASGESFASRLPHPLNVVVGF